MSKRAEEAALRAYPKLCTTGRYGARVDWNEPKRDAYKEGYKQAEKDTIEWVKHYILNHDTIDIFQMEDEFFNEQKNQ